MPAPTAVRDRLASDGLAEGRWNITGVSSDPHRPAPRVHGHLDLRSDSNSRLALSVEVLPADSRSRGSILIDARAGGFDRDGDACFEGAIMSGAARGAVQVCVRSHGVYRHGTREIAWLHLRAHGEFAEVGARHHRRRRLFEIDVNAEIEA